MRKHTIETLFIDTVSGGLRLGLFEDDKLVHSKTSRRADRITEKMAHFQTKNLDRILVCHGPGGFTSARIGVSAGNALSFGLDIPIGTVSLFDLFPGNNITFVTANQAETWVRLPGENPVFLTWEVLSGQLPPSFSFQGILKDPWIKRLEEHGGKWKKKKTSQPDLSSLDFKRKIIKPWYYKGAHITWSEKHAPLYRLNADRKSR